MPMRLSDSPGCAVGSFQKEPDFQAKPGAQDPPSQTPGRHFTIPEPLARGL